MEDETVTNNLADDHKHFGVAPLDKTLKTAFKKVELRAQKKLSSFCSSVRSKKGEMIEEEQWTTRRYCGTIDGGAGARTHKMHIFDAPLL